MIPIIVAVLLMILLGWLCQGQFLTLLVFSVLLFAIAHETMQTTAKITKGEN